MARNNYTQFMPIYYSLGQAFTIIRRRIQSAFMKQIATNGLMELDKMDAKRQERIVFQERVLQLDGWAFQRAEFLEVQVFGTAEGDHDVLELGGEFRIGSGGGHDLIPMQLQ